MFVFKLQDTEDELDYPKFELHKRIVVKDIPTFKKVSMQYHFNATKFGLDPSSIIFAKFDAVFELNFETEEISILHKYREPLSR